MSVEFPVEAAALPEGFCPTTEQQRLDGYAAALSVLLGDYYGQFVISETTPDPADNDKVWLKTDGSGNPIGFFLYVSGAWTQINAPNLWVGAGGGSANAYTLTVSNYPSSTGPRTNDVFVMSIPAASTGAATLNLNSFGNKDIKSAGAALWSGALQANKWYVFVYDGTNYEATEIKEFTASSITPGTVDGDFLRTRDVAGVKTTVWETDYFAGSEQAIPAPGSPVTWTHGLPATPQLWSVVLINKSGDAGYTAGDEVPVSSFFSGGGTAWHSVFANSTTIGFMFDSGATGPEVSNKATGASTAITTGSWRLKAYAFR